MSKGHPGECPEGHGRYRYEKELERGGLLKPVSDKRRAEEEAGTRRRSRGSTLKRSNGFAVSKAQRDKVRLLPCVACGKGGGVDPAHLWPQGKGGCAHPDCVIPLCRSCHRLFDEGKLDLLPRLADSEAWQVEQAHPILVHGVSPVELVRRLSGGSYEFVRVPQTPESKGPQAAPEGAVR